MALRAMERVGERRGLIPEGIRGGQVALRAEKVPPKSKDLAPRGEFSRGSGWGWKGPGVNQNPGISRRVGFGSPSESLLERG